MPMKRCECCGQTMPEFGGIAADDDRGEIRFNGMAAHGLTVREYQLFRYLLDSKGATKSKGSILDHLYQLQADEEPDIEIIDVFICKLRKKLKPLGLEIGTAWARGYFLVAPHGAVQPVNLAAHAYDNAAASP